MTQQSEIKITIKLFAHFQKGRFKEATRSFPIGLTVCNVLEQLQIQDMSSGIVLVNGKFAARDFGLLDGDTLVLFPLISGG